MAIGSRFPLTIRVPTLTPAVLIAALASGPGTTTATALEPPYESLNSAALLPDRHMNGPDYHVRPEVVNRGLMNHYVIETDYGPLRARSDHMLQQRLQEIRALRELRDMHEGVLVARSVGRTFAQTARTVAQTIKDPGGTAQGVQRGIERLARRSGRTLRNAYDNVRTAIDNDDSDDTARPADANLGDKAARASRDIARTWLGVDRAFRDLAREVGVDPYTDNRILHARMDYLARHSAGASLGSRLVIPRIPGLIGVVGNVSELVWNKDRVDLLMHNEQTLASLRIPDVVSRQFINNESYSPTQQTAIVSAVESLREVSNHWRLIEYATYADSAAEADFYTAMIILLALYHDARAALDTLHPTATIAPVALTRDGRAVVAFPVDRFRWTRDVAGIVAALTDSPAGHVKHREIWITGEVSIVAAPKLSRSGWLAFTRAHQRLPTH
jgi:hypothetical protein